MSLLVILICSLVLCLHSGLHFLVSLKGQIKAELTIDIYGDGTYMMALV